MRSQLDLAPQFTSHCPHRGCGESIEVTDQFSLPSTDGDILHFKIRCGSGHWFTIPVEPGAGAADLDRAIRTRLDAQRGSLDWSISGGEVGAVCAQAQDRARPLPVVDHAESTAPGNTVRRQPDRVTAASKCADRRSRRFQR